MLDIRELTTDAEIASAFPLMAQLRQRIKAETFVGEVRRQQRDGFVLLGGAVDGEWVALAGVRPGHTLSRGEHLFVDDLVTAESVRGKGYGTQLLRHVAVLAAKQGIERIYLDSRATAKGFYEQLGFWFNTAIPCSVEVAALLNLTQSR